MMKIMDINIGAEFIYMRTYSRWLEEEGRRENWEETIDRYIDFVNSEIISLKSISP